MLGSRVVPGGVTSGRLIHRSVFSYRSRDTTNDYRRKIHTVGKQCQVDFPSAQPDRDLWESHVRVARGGWDDLFSFAEACL